MASIIRVKRSTGTGAPGTLNFGELGLTVGVGTHGNKGGRLFAGDNAQNAQVVGGRYYTDLLSIAPGLVAGQANPTTAANGFVALLDQNRKVDQWNVDNLRLDTNTLSSTDTDGDIILDPNGSGEIVIPDDTKLTFGTSKDVSIEYDEDGTNQIIVTGHGWQWNSPQIFGSVGISSNTISTKSGSGNELFIDPFPDGLSNEGTVIIKGDLQVDGTTTTVNSNDVTINDAIFGIGDVTSIKTVMGTVASGVSTVLLDSVAGINTGDQLAVSGIDASGIATVTAYNSSTKVVTFTGTAVGVTTTSQVTVTHGFDTNTDRGISFQYNVSSGVGNNKVGFFGYNDSAGEGSSAPARAFTYVPDATITGSTVAGTRGNLDIKGIYYQTGDYETHGVVFFDANGLQTSTNTPTDAVNTRTSTQVLTAVTEITLALPSGQTIAQDALVTQQNNSTAFGVCKTSISGGTTLTLIGVQGTFDATNDLVVNGASISVAPNSVTVVYTNKPCWTNTLDGGTF
tara:strand:+ start:6227 stop:7759 length:1533 start_codon:yes stop_codon:yes gene_type:complete